MDDSQACFLSRHRGLKDVILVAACHRLVRELFESTVKTERSAEEALIGTDHVMVF